MDYTCLIIIQAPGMRLGPGIEPGTFVSADGCSTTELTLLHTAPIQPRQVPPYWLLSVAS